MGSMNVAISCVNDMPSMVAIEMIPPVDVPDTALLTTKACETKGEEWSLNRKSHRVKDLQDVGKVEFEGQVDSQF